MTITRHYDATEAVTKLIEYVGENPQRPGIEDTPERVVKALHEMTAGYRENPATILSKQFDVDCDEMVVLRNIRFTSLCEHHLLPFVGTASVGYIPGAKVVGLSKLARLVHCYAKRFQVQERLTQQVANALMEHAGARGAACRIIAHHSCMGCRGVRQPDAEMVTSCLKGIMRESAEARTEFLALCK